MPAFSYVARDSRGAAQRGRLEAPDSTQAAATLRGRGLLVTEMTLDAAASEAGPRRSWLPVFSTDIEHGLRQIAVMYRAGLTVTDALDGLVESSSWRVAPLWAGIGARVREGATLGEAMAKERRLPAMVVQLAVVGEQTGELDPVLERAADSLERSRLLRNAVMQALFYPAIVTLAAIGVAAALVLYLVPKLEGLLAGSGRQLPWSTQLLVDTSGWLQVNGIGVLIGLAGAAAGLMVFISWPPGRLLVDRLLLRTPIIGPTIRLGGTVLFARSMAALVASGVSMIESLTTVERLLANRAQQLNVGLVRARVSAGEPITPPLREGGTFTALLPQLVSTGERTGALDRLLIQAADFHEEQLERHIRWLGMLVEPVMIVVVGAMVGFVYFAFFQAVYGAIGGLR